MAPVEGAIVTACTAPNQGPSSSSRFTCGPSLPGGHEGRGARELPPVGKRDLHLLDDMADGLLREGALWIAGSGEVYALDWFNAKGTGDSRVDPAKMR